ncbi:MAG: hypothetical protein LBM27_01855 [Lactobacillaceae bacterium]|jgi:lysophospholipase L1-like esterase|nr:hypothetical protein [Lactobacillaceae bacterium]
MNDFPLTIESNAFYGDWAQNERGIFATNLGAQIFFETNNTITITFAWHNNVFDEGQGPSAVTYKIDEGDWNTIELGNHDFSIALPDKGHHNVRVMTKGLTTIRGDYWTGSQRFQIEKISYDGEISGVAPQRDMIYFIGDSITNGQKMKQPSTTPASHYPELSYGTVIADNLDLNGLLIAYGGVGITAKANFATPSGDDFVWYMNSDTKRPLHNHLKTRLVVVNIGTNDSRATDKEFAFSLKSFNRELHKRFHGIKFLYLVPFNQNFVEVFRKLVPTFENSLLVETENWGIEIGDQVHPNFNGEKTIIEKLQPIIEKNI